MSTHLTSDHFPMFLLNGKVLSKENKEFEYVDDVEVIKGKTIVINRAGMLWLYMGDDHRKETPEQIIVKRIGHYEMGFLPIESKRAIKLLNYKYA